jgi:hypothetical protein
MIKEIVKKLKTTPARKWLITKYIAAVRATPRLKAGQALLFERRGE